MRASTWNFFLYLKNYLIIIKYTGIRKTIPNQHLPVQSQQWTHQNNFVRSVFKLTIKTPERRHWCGSGVFIVNFEHISHIAMVFSWLTSNKWILAGFSSLFFKKLRIKWKDPWTKLCGLFQNCNKCSQNFCEVPVKELYFVKFKGYFQNNIPS